MPKYSIIVPVYNMYNLLPQCVKSIKSQAYEDFEVIFADDCSTDGSYELCRIIAEKDSRFKTVRQDKNRGLSATRNLGMQNITGDYVTFIDPDDYVEDNFLSEIAKKQKDNKFDLITWGMYNDIVYPDTRVETEESSLNSVVDKDVLSPDSEDWHHLCMDTFFASTCNKLYRADIISEHNLTFDTGCVDFEDLIFNSQYARYVDSFAILKAPFYHYRQKYGQVAPLKRQWANVERFAVSDNVYKACCEFIETFNQKNIELSDFMRYAYKAYMNEIEYLYRLGDKRGFRTEVGKLADNKNFYSLLKVMVESEIKKLIIPLIILISTKQKRLFSMLLWVVYKRSLG